MYVCHPEDTKIKDLTYYLNIPDFNHEYYIQSM